MRTYQEVLTDLKEVINTKRNKNTSESFKNCLKDLYDNFKIELSTKFLRTLINSDKNNRQKTYRIKYLYRKEGLKTQRRNKYFNGWDNKKRDVKIIEYEHTIGLIYNDFPRHLFNKYMIIEDIKTKENDYYSNKDKLNLRNSINKGYGVQIKNIETQTIGNFFKIHNKEVLFFIIGF